MLRTHNSRPVEFYGSETTLVQDPVSTKDLRYNREKQKNAHGAVSSPVIQNLFSGDEMKQVFEWM